MATETKTGASGFGIGCIAACIVALAAGVTVFVVFPAEGINAVSMGILGLVTTLLGLAAISFQAYRGLGCCRCYTGPCSALCIVICTLGTSLHLTALGDATVYLVHETYDFYDSEFNYHYYNVGFTNFCHWNPAKQAGFIFGCVIGAAAWVAALVLAVLDFYAVRRRQAARAPGSKLMPSGALPPAACRQEPAASGSNGV